MANKFYVVRKGHKPGIYTSWPECQAQVNGFKGAEFKGFVTKALAEDALKNGWDSGAKSKTPQSQDPNQKDVGDYIRQSLSVDAACSGNPGKMEYQGIDTETGEQIFASPVYPVGTNNLGEFLAIVHALRYLQCKRSDMPIYSDSVSALAWVRNRQVKTNLVRCAETKDLWQDIDEAIEWLNTNTYQNPILKWETKAWGESKADFGRK